MGGSRRERVTAAAVGLLTAALVLAGCGSSDAPATESEASPAGTASSLVPEGEGTTQYPFTIETWAGSSVLEERPERIAVIGFSPSWDALEAIGVTPVYIDTEDVYPFNDDAWAENIELKDPNGYPLNLEAIASTDPDLIVAVNSVDAYKEDLDALLDIAPVLETKELAEAPDRLDWRIVQRLVGEALDLSSAAEDAIERAEDSVAAAAAAHPEFEGKTAAVAFDYAGYDLEYYNPTGSNAEGILEDLGFAPNPLSQTFAADAVVSNENIGQLNGDVLLMFYTDEAQRQARESMDVFQRIPAVAEGRYIPVIFQGTEGEPGLGAEWVLRQGASAVSLPLLIDFIADTLAEGLQPNT
ncbi:hypothetical protein CH300_28080 [Rhodococcus sp. 15-1154-1]|nr:hypothetical protein CH300_28080 [Rhodococcus sp. 15-1154-1]